MPSHCSRTMAGGCGRRLVMVSAPAGGSHLPGQDAVVVPEALARQFRLIVADPVLQPYELDGGNGWHMDLAAAWMRVAEAARCAVPLVHHLRTAPADGHDAGTAAGSADTCAGAARSARLLSSMQAAGAELLGVPARERWAHARLDKAASGLAPRRDQARWFRMQAVKDGRCPHEPALILSMEGFFT